MAVIDNKKYAITGEQLSDLAVRLGGINTNAEEAKSKAEEVESSLSNKVDKETGKGLSTNDFTNSDKTKLDSVESNAQENTIESVSVNGTEITPDANKNVDINVPAVENSLTSESTTDALSAAQGKTLKDLIDNIESIKILTEDDYDWPTNNPTKIAGWLLEPGIYKIGAKNREYLNLALTTGGITNVYNDDLMFVIGPENQRIYIIKSSTALYEHVVQNKSVDHSGQIIYGGIVVDSLDNTRPDRPLSANQGKVLNEKIGDITTLTTTDKSSTVAAINELDTELDNVKSLSGNSSPTTATEGEIGQFYIDTSTGDIYYLESIDETTDPDTYNWTKLATGTGVNVVQTTGTSTTDVMSQNATTKMVFDNGRVRIGTQASVASVYATGAIAIGQAKAGSSISGAGAIAIGGGGNETTSSSGSHTVAIGVGAFATGANYSIAVGSDAQATANDAIAIGKGSRATRVGEVNIGTTDGSQYNGYNSSNYRLLSGLYDPQSDHDAATKGYVDTNIPDAPSDADFNALWS